MQDMVRCEGLLSNGHFGAAGPDCVETQLSRAMPAYGLDSSHFSTVNESRYGAYCGKPTVNSSSGCVRPFGKLLTKPGMSGSCAVVAKVLSSKVLASL